MRFTDKQIADFIEIYKEKFGIELTVREVHEEALDLIDLMRVLLLENRKCKKPYKQLKK